MRARERERFKEPLGIYLDKSTAICEDEGSAYDAGHKQVNENCIGSHGICSSVFVFKENGFSRKDEVYSYNMCTYILT